MEYEEIAPYAMGTARRWLSSAKLNAKVGNYDSALYSLEMAVEISMKALLLSLGMEVPKVHDICDIVSDALKNDRRIQHQLKGRMSSSIDTFNELLGLRSVSGYVFETGTSLKELKEKYENYAGKAEEIVGIYGKAVESITGKKKK